MIGWKVDRKELYGKWKRYVLLSNMIGLVMASFRGLKKLFFVTGS
jgi:hypothetical protein